MTRVVVGLLCLGLALGGCAGADGGAPPSLGLTVAERTADPGCAAHWVAGVRGRVVDSDGFGASGVHAQMCLRLADHAQLCLAPVLTDASGWYATVLPEDARCLESVVVRVLKTGDATRYATGFAVPAMAPIYGVLDVREVLELHPLARPDAAPPMGDPAATRTLRFESGLELDVTPEALDLPTSYEFLAASEVPIERAPGFARDAGFLGLWALGPELSASPPIAFRLPNRHGLAEGTRLRLYLVGGIYTELANGAPVEEGELAAFGTATVIDGRIVSDVGSGLPYLTWLGYRPLDEG